MTPEAKLELHLGITAFAAAHGDLVDHRESEYGWQGYDTGERDHVRECGVNPAASSWEDSEWSEFLGTFAETPWQQRTGIDAVVTCNCGLVENEKFRYTGGYARLIRAITEGEE